MPAVNRRAPRLSLGRGPAPVTVSYRVGPPAPAPAAPAPYLSGAPAAPLGGAALARGVTPAAEALTPYARSYGRRPGVAPAAGAPTRAAEALAASRALY